MRYSAQHREGAVEGHIAAVVKKAGTVDISFSAITPIPQPGTQGIPIATVVGRDATIVGRRNRRSRFLESQPPGSDLLQPAGRAIQPSGHDKENRIHISYTIQSSSVRG